MNKRIKQLAIQASEIDEDDLLYYHPIQDPVFAEKFAELMTNEFIGILQSEIATVEHYRSTSITDRDAEWHEGKIDHFRKLIKKTKEHFGVEK